jgi:outer membrane protein TolC
MSTSSRLALRGLAFLALPALLASPAFAQPLPPAPPPPVAPAAPRPDQPPAMPPAGVDPLAIALAPQAGGLTVEEVGKAASTTKHSVRSKRADLEAAAAKVDQAMVGYFPRLTLTASYTRLSPLPTVGSTSGGVALPFANNAGPLKVTPCATGMGNCVTDATGAPVQAAPVSSLFSGLFPFLPNSTSFVASLSVPISDYVLRVSQGYASAKHAEKGARLNLEAETLQAAADAKIAYYNWVRARGQVVVTKEAVAQARVHVEDANKTFAVGLISRADVLRLEAQVASAQQVEAEAEAFELVAEEQLRVVIGLTADRPLAIGTDVMHEQPAGVADSLQTVEDQALSRRLEIRALDETELSLKETVKIARAGYLPRVDGFADATMANPNPRVLPATDKFYGTWDLGARLTWTINDSFTAAGATAEAKARAASIAEQKGTLKDGLRVEVTSAYSDVQKAAVTIEAADRQVVAAEESYRVRRELFRNGKATSVDLVDAETEVTRARLARLNARIGLLVARVRLEHATGRDVPARPETE